MLVGVVDYFGSTDKVATQTMYLNFINLASFIYIVRLYNFKNSIGVFKNIFSKIPILLMSVFFLWSSVTIIVAVNVEESLKTLTEIFTILVSFIMLVFFINREDSKEKLIRLVILSTLIIELVTIYFPYLKDIFLLGQPIERSLAYRGMTGSVNIISYTVLMKLPFIIYYTIIKKKYHLYYIFLSLLMIYSIIGILETRSAILTLITIIILCLYTVYRYYILNKLSSRNSIKKSLFITVLPFLIAIILNNFSSSVFNTVNVQNRLETLTRLQGDDSLNERFRYFEAGISSIIKNPIFGIGVGNWEVESIKYDNMNMVSYVVPYHAHNDYIEIFAETGLIGFISYFGAIFIVLFSLFKSSLFIKNNQSKEQLLFNTLICISILVYLSDSLFNFPFDRTYQQINLIFLLSIGLLFSKNKENRKQIPVVKYFSVLFLLLPLNLYSSVVLYKSSVEHNVLLKAFNNQDFSFPSLEIIDRMNDTYPTLTPTTLPIKSVKGLYYIHHKDYYKAIELLQAGTKYNPYLYMSEAYIAYAYWRLNQVDSANYYAKKAFYNLPNNIIHFRNYAITLAELKDSTELKKAYEYIPIKLSENKHEEIYLTALSTFLSNESKASIIEDLDFDLQSGSSNFKRGYYNLQIGNKNMIDADYFYQLGEAYFSQKRFEEAAKLFLRASQLNPFELPYKENYANSLLRLGEFNKSLEVLNELINVDKTKSINAIYLRALAYLNLENFTLGCVDLKILEDIGWLGNNRIYQNFCLRN